MALIDKYSKEELEQIVLQSSSMKEVIDKLGYSTHSGNNRITVKNRLEKFNISTNHFSSPQAIKRNEDNIFINPSTASQAVLRRWYIKGKYTDYVCSICGQQPIWNDKPLTLILDHINGSNHDDRLENLRWVCPNCNAQLETTGYTKFRTGKSEKVDQKKYYCINCGKEITRSSKSGKCIECSNLDRRVSIRPDRMELKGLIRNLPFTQIALKYNVSDNAVRKWCAAEHLPTKKTEIKKYSDAEWDLI